MTISTRTIALAACLLAGRADAADTVYWNGRVITLEGAEGGVVEALAVRDGVVLATGSSEEVFKAADAAAGRVDLGGATVIPGIIESHCHSIGAARAALAGEYAELRSIGEIQDWIKAEVKRRPAGQWIEVPRNEITRIRERRFPTPAELDEAAPDHPVLFVSVTKSVLNTAGWRALGVNDETGKVAGGEVLFEEGRPVLMRGGQAALRAVMPVVTAPSPEAVEEKHADLLRIYNQMGITTIFERATDRQGFDFFRRRAADGALSTRVRATFRFSAKTAEDAGRYIDNLGLQPAEGDDMVRAVCMKITVDGGIHWGTTWLSEPHGGKRTRFYRNEDPAYTGNQGYSREQMEQIFGEVERRGWPMSAHVTGDGGAIAVLEAVRAVSAAQPGILRRRFNLIHCYFPTPGMARLAAEVGAGVDTQGYLYYRDADFIAKIYGPEWAERFIGLGEWRRAGVPVGLNSDHMIGFDPDHAMNSFNPFLMLQIAVTRRDDHGNVYGESLKLSRLDALRSITEWPAWLSFDEERLGTLAPGKLADFVVLDRDYLSCPEEEIRGIRPLLTILGGRVVWDGR
jgi:predicted amidohydrolase YtcJ